MIAITLAAAESLSIALLAWSKTVCAIDNRFKRILVYARLEIWELSSLRFLLR